MNDLLLEKEASKFRTEKGLNNNEPIRLKSLLQKANVITVFAPLSDNFSGMAIKAEQQGITHRFILVNNSQSLGKQHFTICHELYHLFVQPEFNSQVCITGTFDKKSDKNEYNADVFASYLLLPTEGIIGNIPNEEITSKKVTLRTVLFIENLYSCSRRAILYRLRKLNLITRNEYNDFCVNIKRGAIENGYPAALYEPGNNNLVIGNYGAIAKGLFDQERISQSHYYTLLTDLGIDTSRLNEINDGGI